MAVTGPSLIVLSEGRRYALRQGQLLEIGRDTEEGVDLADPRVSRRHAVVRERSGGWVYEDTGSTNGSFLGDRRVQTLAIDQPTDVTLGDPNDGPQLHLLPVADTRARRGPDGRLIAGLAALALIGLWLVAASGSDRRASELPASTAAPSATARSRAEVSAIAKSGTLLLAGPDSFGSGIYLGDRLVLTAAHVVPGSGTIRAFFGGREVAGVVHVVRVDKADDLALLDVAGLEALEVRPVEWGDSDALREGDALVAAGFSGGTFEFGLPLSVKFGGVSGFTYRDRTRYVQTDATLNHGMSGGPLLDADGRLVGVIDLTADARFPGVGFAIASSIARTFVDAAR